MWFVVLLVIGFSIAPGICILLLCLLCAYLMAKGPGVVVAICLFLAYTIYSVNQSSKRDTTRRDIILDSKEDGFVPTKEIREKQYVLDYAVYIDEASKKIMFANLLENQRVVYGFEEIIDCMILEDNVVTYAVRKESYPPKQNPLVASLNPPKKVIRSLIIKIVARQTSYEIPVITSSTELFSEPHVAGRRFTRNVFDTVQEIVKSTKQQSHL